MQRQYQGYWLFRCPAQSTLPAVEQFIRSGREQALITLQPPKGEAITVRAIRLPSPDGTLSARLTNWLDEQRFSTPAIVDLYFRRWAVETHDRDEKTSLDIETFHSHTENGGPMKGSTMLATLQGLGVMPSFSRPAVSNGNPYSESLFKTLKYRPTYPLRPFADLAAARHWVIGGLVQPRTPAQRDSLRDAGATPCRRGRDATGKTPSRLSRLSLFEPLGERTP